MPNTILDKFGAEFISGVRNEAIDEWSLILQGKMKDAKSQSIFPELDALPSSCREFVEKYFHEVIDSTGQSHLIVIFWLFCADVLKNEANFLV